MNQYNRQRYKNINRPSKNTLESPSRVRFRSNHHCHENNNNISKPTFKRNGRDFTPGNANQREAKNDKNCKIIDNKFRDAHISFFNYHKTKQKN